MDVLVTGGAGYIGSFITRLLTERGHSPVVLDNLSLGHRAAVANGAKLIVGDLSDRELLDRVFRDGHFDAVMHFAAFSAVGESVVEPLNYYHNNVANTVNLLGAAKDAGTPHFIFSSSAAVYGNPRETPIKEAHPQQPINPYGRAKRIVEQILADTSQAHGTRYVSLRYFNAAGADPEGVMGEDHRRETHLIPLVLKAILGEKAGGRPLTVYGTDYDTPDGTCIRDYIHVLDLAEAHLLALEYLAEGGTSQIFNLGNGKGFSVSQVIDVAEKVTGLKVPLVRGERRPGDPPVLVAGSEKISGELRWRPRFPELEAIVETAWKWHESHPEGYMD